MAGGAGSLGLLLALLLFGLYRAVLVSVVMSKLGCPRELFCSLCLSYIKRES